MESKFPKATVIMVSYNRPLFIRESIPSLIENSGFDDFEFIVWDNGSNKETVEELLRLQKQYGFELLLNEVNIGQQAWGRLLELARGEYFVLTEEDMIWFQPNWLKNLIQAMEVKNIITTEGKKIGFQDEWGILATNVLVDKVNNGGMWKSRFKGMIEKEIDGIHFWTNIRAGAGAMIWKTKTLKDMEIMTPYVHPFNKALDAVIDKYDQLKYPQAQVRDIYIYHAASPYYNQLYPDVWSEKQVGQTIKEAFRIYNDLGKFNFKDMSILKKLKNGTFKQYAEKLFKIFNNRRGRVYSFELTEKTTRRSSNSGHKIRSRHKKRKAGKRVDKKV